MSDLNANNPGLGGLKQLTAAEVALVQQLNALGAPGADRILFYQQSTLQYQFLSLGTNLSIAGVTLNATGEAVLTFSSGLTRVVNTITNDLITGKAGSQIIYGGTAASENLSLRSTTNATKGFIIIGSSGISAYDDTLNHLGIGTTTPLFSLTVFGNNANDATINNRRFSTNINGAILNLMKARGTSSAPTAVLNGDQLGQYQFGGYVDAVHANAQTAGQIDMYATENFTAIAHGAEMRFYVTSNGSTVETLALTLGNNLAAVFASTVSATQFTSTIATGTAPFVVTSTTPVANLSIGGNAATATALNSTAVASSGITMNTAKMLGRATAGVGAIEEIATTGTGSAVLATSPTLVTPVLGTPSSGTLTNCTGLPAAGVVGTAAVLGGNTFTGKNVTAGMTEVAKTYAPASGAQTVTIDCSVNNMHEVTGNASGTAITFAITGDTNSQVFCVSILQGAVVSTISGWFATVRWAGGVAPTLTATVGKRDTFIFKRTGASTYDGFVVGQNA